MVRPIPAVGLASALVQIIDFTINTLRKDHPIFQPSDPSTTPVENAAFLQDLVQNLYRLIDLIDQSELKKIHDEKSANKAAKKLSEAAQQLLKLSDQTKELTTSLIDALIAAQTRGSFGDPRWGTAREALTNGVWKQGDVTGAKKKFRALRREVETALLLALRQYLDQSAESGLPVFTAEDSGRLHHWEKWQNTALDAIHANDWKHNKKKNVEEFSKQVDTLIQAEKEAHFCETMFKLLWFEELDDRLNSIAKPLGNGFEFVFGESQQQVGGLLEWFGSSRGEGLYWVTGKPGSGKTTLMKHLFRNPRIFSSLEAWSGPTPGITSGFFFWGCGNELQKSSVGLLRTILYESLQDMVFGPLEQGQDVIQWLFTDRWNQFTSYGGGLHEFSFPELRRAFEVMVSDVSKKFLFLIDGLDEMDEYPNELIDMILSATKKDHIKICVSSRESAIFLTAFEQRPRLVVNEHTDDDIQAYVKSTFNREIKLEKLRGKRDGEKETSIVSTLAKKASGVFLWATLSTAFLLLGLQEGDDFLVLKDRADALPYQLDDLLPHILDKVEITDLEAIWKVHVLLQKHSYPGILPLSFALTAEIPATFAADVRPLKPVEITKRIDDMHTLLTQQCKTLVTIYNTGPPEQLGIDESPDNLKVTYTHRAIRDYLFSQPELFSKIPTNASTLFAEQQWANAHLWTLKTLALPLLSPSSSDAIVPLRIWTPLSRALEASLTLCAETKKLPLTYMHAALSTAIFLHLKSETGSDLPYFPGPLSSSSSSSATSATSLTTALDLAVLLNLQGYVAVKAKGAERKDVRHAIEFNREMRKRLGAGGEARWFGTGGGGVGKGNEGKLKAEYGRVRTEMDALLEYYAKAVRFGTPKPHVDVPEYV
ncbi:uncharacterized protein K460DRAFT_377005 [Cucurbitaria berberidis CBS 394.84]|uniref:Nephrocystin 3-like N-terminal domain-containing protein n=1 Tax=Cucurbitaria berberidis CBS 394.84 TaxID=1168544 RepID=A0A9P4L8U0_9PLEO|nr:uncharacterized protein K460DRAFT_377005 [Cucurbitaria berberidis CBS 394.84]KAF1845633.1 hypothetical protein K460DRAFT_377005 [Cucurbitaria berberidis CBS 394.84]